MEILHKLRQRQQEFIIFSQIQIPESIISDISQVNWTMKFRMLTMIHVVWQEKAIFVDFKKMTFRSRKIQCQMPKKAFFQTRRGFIFGS